MNPLKFLWEDAKSDFATITEVCTNGLDPTKTERIKKEFTTGWGDFLKKNWLLFLLLALAFASGYFMAGKHYQNLCNQYIFTTYIEPQMIAHQGLNYVLDIPANFMNNVSNFSIFS